MQHLVGASVQDSLEMEEYSSEMGQHLDNLRKAGLFCDVEIVLPADNKRLHVHRNILASCSRYFRSLFTSVMAGSGQIEVQLPGTKCCGSFASPYLLACLLHLRVL